MCDENPSEEFDLSEVDTQVINLLDDNLDLPYFDHLQLPINESVQDLPFPEPVSVPVPNVSGTTKLASKAQSSQSQLALVNHPQLQRCIDKTLAEGTLVWAQAQSSIFWPACVIIPPPPDDDAPTGTESISDIDENHEDHAFVMFIETKFRLGLVKWSNIIELDVVLVNAQKDLIVNLNKLLFRKRGAKTSIFDRSCILLTELIHVLPQDRKGFMQKKFDELNNQRRMTPKVPKVKVQVAQVDVAVPPSDSSPLVNSPRPRMAALRQNPRSSQQWAPVSPQATPGSSEVSSVAGSDQSAVTKKTNSNPKFSRPKVLEGEALQEWTRDKFEGMDASMKFDSKPTLCCAHCKLEIDYEVVTCHDYPFHKSCLIKVPEPPADNEGDDIATVKYKCFTCINSLCFICAKGRRDDDNFGSPTKCSRCDLLFHRDCLVFHWPQADVAGSSGPITCPLHFCHGCKAEHIHSGIVRDYRLPSPKGIRCVFCLSAYHKASCVPAGAGNTIMKNQFLICPRHSSEAVPRRRTKRLGCFSCKTKLNSKDSVVNCMLCPLSFHSSCVHGEFHVKMGIDLESLQKTFKCEGCHWGMFPRYGQVVWFQQPGSTYYPSMILYPKDCTARKATAEGQFSVGYCGYPIQFYDNGRAGDCLLFEIGHDKNFLKKLHFFPNDKVAEAHKEAFQLLKYSDAHRDKILPKPEPLFRKIERNLYRMSGSSIIRKQPGKRKNSEAEERCVCGESGSTEPTCTPDSGCFNRDASIECTSTNCSGKERCENRMFSLKQHKEALLEVFVSATTKGYGVKANHGFTEGTFLCEYLGEVISKDERQWRLERKADDDPLYFLEIDSSSVIDAEYYGSVARLINHSCDANCKIVKYKSIQGKPVVGIFAKRDIEIGEELSFDYNWGPKSTFAFVCRCKSAKCKRVIGRKGGSGDENLAPARYHANSEGRWDDECSTCGMRGELLMCEFSGCRKTHHLQCLNLAATPEGTWFCPLHDDEDDLAGVGTRKRKLLKVKGPPAKKRKVTKLSRET